MALDLALDPGDVASVAWWIWVSAAALLLVAAVVGLLEGTSRRPPIASLGISALAGVAVTILGLAVFAADRPLDIRLGAVLGFVPLSLAFDRLSAVFLLALGPAAVAASLFGVGYVRTHHGNPATGAAYPLFLLSLAVVFGAGDAFAFLLAWESMALLSAVLVFGPRPTRDVIGAGYVYLAMTHLATAALVVGFAAISSAAGGRTEFDAFRLAAGGMSPLLRDLVFVLVLVGFGTKAGAMPLHVWLPRAHPVAPSHVSALMSGVMLKAGIYGLLRIAIDVLGPGPDWWGLVVIVIGAASAALGVLYALMERDLKRLLAFSSVENIGIILLGVGAALILRSHGEVALASLAIVAALFHTLNHAVGKTLLFLGAGAVQVATGLRDLDRLGGLARTMPLTALAFGLGAMTLAGLPPLNGFASEWLTFQGLISVAGAIGVPGFARFGGVVAAGALALTAALAVAAFVMATGTAFLARPRSPQAEGATEPARPMLAALLVLAWLIGLLTVAAGPITKLLARVADGLVGAPAVLATSGAPALTVLPEAPGRGVVALGALALIVAIAAFAGWGAMAGWRRAGRAIPARSVPSWTGGIVPTPAMEYTATSFAKPVRLFFRRVLLPAREVRIDYHPGTPFPRTIRYRSEVTLLLDERVFGPLHRFSLRAAELVRRLQSGSLQLYLAYVIVTLVILLVLAR